MLIYCRSYRMYRTEASRRNQWEGGIEKETERKLRGLRELREEGRRSRESGSEFASFARLREAGSRSAECFGPAKHEDLKAREPGSLQKWDDLHAVRTFEDSALDPVPD